MTYEEAHKYLEIKQREMTQNRHIYTTQSIDINGLAILAVEKQIPKKFVLYLRCPNCNYDNLSTADKYCKHCGQALDWSGVNEL